MSKESDRRATKAHKEKKKLNKYGEPPLPPLTRCPVWELRWMPTKGEEVWVNCSQLYKHSGQHRWGGKFFHDMNTWLLLGDKGFKMVKDES